MLKHQPKQDPREAAKLDADIKRAGYIQGKSVMPANMTSGLNDQGLLDLTAYLHSLK